VLRKSVFWIHLVCGVATGLVILMMSFTGVVLTYERQILDWADARSHAAIDADAGPRQSIESLVVSARASDPGFRPTSVIVSSDPKKAVTLSAGRGGGSLLLDPYSGEVLGEGALGLRSFFGAVTGWHRWFNASGEARGPWRALTAVSNLAFLFLLLSGLYLWLPRVFKWTAFRMHLWFNPKARTAKARDYNWHHVFGFWTAIPLIVIVYTATVFYFDWSNDLLYRAFGEQPPQRGRPPAAAALAPGNTAHEQGPAGAPLPLDRLLDKATRHVSDWQRITLQLPDDGARDVRFTIDRGSGGQPQHRHTLRLDSATGHVAAWEPFESQTPGRQARSWVRFLHTGEAFGVVGQTIAGFVSATTILMVWTGFALAWRRLISPLMRRNSRS
jgi:uncharacterized iron-regulated membrane protein